MYPRGTAVSSEVWLDELHTREAVERSIHPHKELFGEKLFDGQRFPIFGFTTSAPRMPQG